MKVMPSSGWAHYVRYYVVECKLPALLQLKLLCLVSSTVSANVVNCIHCLVFQEGTLLHAYY